MHTIGIVVKLTFKEYLKEAFNKHYKIKLVADNDDEYVYSARTTGSESKNIDIIFNDSKKLVTLFVNKIKFKVNLMKRVIGLEELMQVNKIELKEPDISVDL